MTGKNMKDHVSTSFASVLPSQENSLHVMLESWAFAEMIKIMSREGSRRMSRKIKLISVK